MQLPARKHIADFLLEKDPALRVRVASELGRPPSVATCSCPAPGPREVGSVYILEVTWFGTPVGKQRSNEPERIDFGTQARQIHLFFSQHFIYVFHGRQAGPAMALISFRVEMNCVLPRLDYAEL